jgi:hypothetical protein
MMMCTKHFGNWNGKEDEFMWQQITKGKEISPLVQGFVG